jgi:U4/U6.U5 tri-snRNP-associated protein 1
VGDVILTLKDSSILDDGEIELESSELVEKRKLENKLRAKRGLRANDDEDDEYKPGNVLSKYNDIIGDEEISNSGSFTLDGSTVLSKVPVTNDVLLRKKNTVKESLEFDAQLASKDYGDDDITGMLGADYQEAKPVKFKKSKKKKSKPQAVKKRKADDDDDIPLVDDDFDIQNALSASRQKAQQLRVKKARILTPQELADEIKNEEKEDSLTPQPETNGLVISSTTDFLNVIKQRAANDEQEEKPKTQQRRRREETPEEEEQLPPTIEDVSMDNDLDSAESAPAMSAIDASTLAPEEPTLSGGMADALKLLRTHGVLSKPNESDSAEQQLKKQQREWSRQLTRTKIKRDMELARAREEVRESGLYDHLSQREREELAQQSNRERDLADARDAQRSFANYKPVINIEYRDEAGRLLSTKEAYKHMSHHFHGKGPGKGRVEKQLKRDEEEKKNMAKPLFGSGSEGKRASGNAGVRLQ